MANAQGGFEKPDQWYKGKRYYNLTVKQWKFCLAYVGEAQFDGMRAALMSYGTVDENNVNSMTAGVARSVAAQNLQKSNVVEAISDLLSSTTMKPNEILNRLSKFAKITEEDFFDTNEKGQMVFNYQKAKDRGMTGLIKKVNFDSFGGVRSIELHDAFASLVQLGKHHRLFDRAGEMPPDHKEIARELLAELQVEYEDIPKTVLAERVLKRFRDKGVRMEDLIPEFQSDMVM